MQRFFCEIQSISAMDLIEPILEWAKANQAWLWWIVGASFVAFVGTLIAVPIILVRMRADYFVPDEHESGPLARQHPALRWSVLILKNLLGGIFVIAGIPMLIGPGQGVITVLIGLSLINFPGKSRFQSWLVTRRPIEFAINALRRKFHKPPLQRPEQAQAAERI